jgi:hypothetical protein
VTAADAVREFLEPFFSIIRQGFLVRSKTIVSLLCVFSAGVMPAWCQETPNRATNNQSQSQGEAGSDQKSTPAASIGSDGAQNGSAPAADTSSVGSPNGSNPRVESKPAAEAPAKATAAVTPAKPGDRPPPPGFDAAEKLYTAHKFALAQKAFEKFINAGVADVKTHLELAYCLYYQRMYSKAVKEFDWVAKNAKLLSMQRSAEATARTLKCYRMGICPANCLKANDPRWQRLPDKDPNELWIRFPFSGGWAAWSNHHIGDRVEYVNGKPQNLGTCPVCGGTGEVDVLKDGAPLPR